MIDNREYVHLHVHTEYSLMEATCRLEKLIQKAKLFNMKALAITDKGSINGVIRFVQLAKAYRIHPIIGCGMKVSEGEELVLLATNNNGYEQIVKWINFCFTTQSISKGDIIALSGGRSGLIYQFLKEEKFLLAEELVLKYVDWFGKENFYLEIQQHHLENDHQLIKRTIELSKKLGIGIVATQDVHYLEPEDVEQVTILGEQNTGKIPKTGPFYFASQKEMKEKFSQYPDAINNTYLIAKRCHYKDKLKMSTIPNYPIPNDQNQDSFLKELCELGLQQHFDLKTLHRLEQENIMKRLKDELDVISHRRLSTYFLIVWDMVGFALKSNIAIGPGRGSSTGSLVAFLLGITQINPILHQLSFERFLSRDRTDVPDIDLDVCHRRRHEILEYLKAKYGQEKVVHVGVCNTFGTRGSIRKVGAFLNIEKQKIDVIAGLMPSFRGIGGIHHCLQTLPELRKLPVDKEPYRSLFYFAEKIEGLPYNYASHPSGILIGDEKLPYTIPLKQRSDGDFMTTFNKEDIKELGLLKYDLLGLRNLTIIDDTCRALRKGKGIELEVTKLQHNDLTAFQAIHSGNTLGCFQLESMGIRYLMRKMKPKNIHEMAILLALYRPGAWKEGIVNTYLRRRSREETYNYIVDEMEPILSSTYGLIIYQEQVMEIAHVIAGYSMGEADILRRALAKKQAYSIELHRRKFIKQAVTKGFTTKKAREIFDFIAHFAGYSFNKAHSIAYAYMSYWTVYLKTHYPKEYMASLLSLEGGYYEKRVYIREVKKMGIPLLGPDVNRSGIGFNSEKKGIRIGMNAIKGSGPHAITSLIECRKDGLFTSFEDLLSRIKKYKVKQPILKTWVLVGACDGFGNSRKQMLKLMKSSQINLFEYLPNDSNHDYSKKEKRQLEKEFLGFYLEPVSPHKIKQFLFRYNIIPIEKLWNIDHNMRVRIAGTIIHLRRQPTKNDEYILTLVLQDHSEMVEVVVYSKTYKMYLYELNPQGIIVEGILKNLDMTLYITAEKIKALGG